MLVGDPLGYTVRRGRPTRRPRHRAGGARTARSARRARLTHGDGRRRAPCRARARKLKQHLDVADRNAQGPQACMAAAGSPSKEPTPMSAVKQTTDLPTETTDQPAETTDQPVEASDQATETTNGVVTNGVPAEPVADSKIPLELGLDEAEALRAWLLKPAADGTTSLDDQLVSRVLSRLGLAVDSARSTVSVRQELVQAGFAVDHLSDDQVRDLGRRIADAASPGIRLVAEGARTPTDGRPPARRHRGARTRCEDPGRRRPAAGRDEPPAFLSCLECRPSPAGGASAVSRGILLVGQERPEAGWPGRGRLRSLAPARRRRGARRVLADGRGGRRSPRTQRRESPRVSARRVAAACPWARAARGAHPRRVPARPPPHVVPGRDRVGRATFVDGREIAFRVAGSRPAVGSAVCGATATASTRPCWATPGACASASWSSRSGTRTGSPAR